LEASQVQSRKEILKSFEEQHKAKLAELDLKQNQGLRIKNVWIYNLDTELD
jgi:hypothetical protein